jgi:hypothetical protein
MANSLLKSFATFGLSNLLPDGEGGGNGSQTQQPLQPAWQQQTGQDLSEWVRKFLKLYNPGEAYPGAFPSAAPTGFESQGLQTLGSYLNSPNTGDLFGAARGQVLDTLGGRYADPAQSPFIQSMIALAKQNLGDDITTARRGAGARGTYFTRSALQGENQLRERSNTNLNAIIGDYINQERARQQQAVGQAQGLEQYAESLPLRKVAASQLYGGLERTLNVEDFERQYQDFQRQRGELAQVPGQAQGVYGTGVPYGFPTYTPPQQMGAGSQFLQIAAKILPLVLGMA